MMGRGTFILLKGRLLRPKSAKQAKMRLAVLPTILLVARFWPRKIPAKGKKIPVWVVLPAISAGYG
jgi:hypothetical protein